VVNLAISEHMEVNGVCLTSLTQSLAYTEIMAHRNPTPRKATDAMVDLTKLAVAKYNIRPPTTYAIWKAIRKRDIHRRVRNFLYIILHDRLKVGKFWKHIPTCEGRQNCQYCGEVDNIDHILLNCKCPHRALIWDLAQSLWPAEYGPWPEISLGSIIGCSLIKFHDQKQNPLPQAQRLFTILVTECAHLIWKIRCEIVIDQNGEDPAAQEVYNRFRSLLNSCLQKDIQLTNVHRWGNYAVSESTVRQAW
ncbi:hypothetical protein GYMLUDRAFT_110534, partial [Collybiopsis luxurians FD-317 M1]